MSRVARNCYQCISKSLPHLVRASTSAKPLLPLVFQHASWGKIIVSTSQFHEYSGMSEGHNPLGEPRKISGEGKRPRHPFAGPVGRIRRAITEDKHKKWGFLMYRCDYSNDDVWEKFIIRVRHEIGEHLRILKAEDLQDTLEMTTKEDSETLDGATVDQVRDLFNKWVQSDEAKAENNDTPYAALFQFPRYRYCVHVDADVIESVVNRAPQPPEHDFDEIGYVNLVHLVHGD